MYAEQFDRDGYVHVPQAIDAKTIADLRTLALAELKAGNTTLIVDTVFKYPAIRSLLERPKLGDALAAIFRTPFLVLPPTSIDHNGFGLFHTDTTGIELSGKNFHRDPNFRAAVLAIYLQDNDQHGGGIRIVPGGHREQDPFIEKYNRKHAVQKALNESRFKRLANRYSGGRLFGWDRSEFEELPGQIDVNTKQGDAAFWDMRMCPTAPLPTAWDAKVYRAEKIRYFHDCV